MLTMLCADLHNYFIKDPAKDIHFGTFTIEDGEISPADFLSEGQFFRIVGSMQNDGVYEYASDSTILADEEFEGSVWAMSVPPAVIALSDDIDTWCEKNQPSAFTSESFGGYSYTKAKNAKGQNADWHDVFASRLNIWRKMRTL